MFVRLTQVLCTACSLGLVLTAPKGVFAQVEEAAKPRVVPTAVVLSPAKLSAEDRIRVALAETTSLDFAATPLKEAMQSIASNYGILVRLDRKALDEAGIDTDVPVTLKIEKVSLRSALNLMLRDLDLIWMVRDEVLLITPPEVAETALTTKVYDVSDLVVSLDDDGKPVDVDFDSLIDVINNSVEPSTWEEVGGPGSVAPFLADGLAVIVVSQTDKVHEKLQKLLFDLRQIRGKGAAIPKGVKLPDPRPRGGFGGDGGFGGGFGGGSRGGFF